MNPTFEWDFFCSIVLNASSITDLSVDIESENDSNLIDVNSYEFYTRLKIYI